MNKKDLLIIFLVVLFGILSRTIFHIGHNTEFITAISLASGYFFTNKKLSILTTFLILAISDLVIGNSIIMIFTWSAFLFGNLIGIFLSKIKLSNHKLLKLAAGSEIAAIFSTIVFFLWTNLGVVLTTNAYQKTFEGVMQSYMNGLVFLRPQMIGNMIFVPLIFIGVYLAINSKFTKQIGAKFNFY